MPEVPGQHDDADPCIAPCRIFEQMPRVVAAPVVNEDDFMRPSLDPVKNWKQAREKLGEDFLLVVHGDPHGQPHARLRPWK
jgi:hypothetical protein